MEIQKEIEERIGGWLGKNLYVPWKGSALSTCFDRIAKDGMVSQSNIADKGDIIDLFKWILDRNIADNTNNNVFDCVSGAYQSHHL